MESFLESAFILRSLTTFSRAVSVLWWARKPDWKISKVQFNLRKSFNCLKTVFSRILLKKGRLETGLKFLGLEVSRLLFLSMGLTMAVFSAGGKIPVVRDLLTMTRISLDTDSKIVLKKSVGIGSNEHVVDFRLVMTFFSVSVSTGVNKLICLLHIGGGSMCKAQGLSREIFLLIFIILSLKYVANSSHLEFESRLSGVFSSGFISLSIVEKSTLVLFRLLEIRFEK